MHLLLPLVTERQDPLQGILARQIPRILAERLRECGVTARAIPLLAERDGQRAHVLLQAPIPEPMRQSWAADAGAECCVQGRVTLHAGSFELSLELLVPHAHQVHELIFRGPRMRLPSILAEAVAAIAAHAGHGAAPTGEPVRPAQRGADDIVTDAGHGAAPTGDWQARDAEALIALLTDLDNEALLTEGAWDPELFTDREDAWRWAHRAWELDPEWELARRRLVERIDALEAAGATLEAMNAALAMARHRAADAMTRSRAAALVRAHAEGDAAALNALRSLGAPETLPADVRLMLGQELVREGFHADARKVLEPLFEDESTGELASAWAGVAEASQGEVERALSRWHSIAEKGRNPEARRMAQENLQRAAPLAGPEAIPDKPAPPRPPGPDAPDRRT